MRPTVLSNANASASAGVGGGGVNPNSSATNGINIPIHHEYGNAGHPQANAYYADPNAAAYGSPRQQPQQSPQQQAYHPHAQGSQSGQPQQQQQHPHQQIPQHFQQGFGFEPDMDMDMDMDMFPRSRLGRMHDPFGSFNNSPDFANFPQFNSLGRRRAADHMGRDDDFFNRLPSEFRQYIPEGFGHRRGADSATTLPRQHSSTQQVPVQGGGGAPAGYYQTYVPAGSPSNGAGGVPQTPSKKLCDAAIQTEDPTVRAGGDQVDSAAAAPQHQGDNLKQHGLRNTVDMGVKSALESEHGTRAHSAPPQEQQQPVNGKRQTPPPQPGQSQFGGTQTSPNAQGAGGQPQFHKAYYPPQQQPHPQQRTQSTPPPPQTPGGTYVRTIPIFVEGRSEPIINAHKEIPNQHSAPQATARAPQPQQQKQQYQPQPQQQHRPTPLNTQQQSQGGAVPQAAGAGVPPQTPHTLDSISKIQDIQRDVLDLMGHVEKFTGTRQDKEYAYLDEMLTRNLLKLDTIDTNGKDSIRLARKEAIKCIQASINVLEAKANENTKAAEQAAAGGVKAPEQTAAATTEAPAQAAEQTAAAARKSASREKVEAAAKQDGAAESEAEPSEAKAMQAPIPLPPPEGMQVEDALAAAAASAAAGSKEVAAGEGEAAAPTEGGSTIEASAKDAAESSK